MTQRFNGLSFTTDFGGTTIKVMKFTLDVEDNTAVAKRDGKPDGWLLGDVAASGTATVDATNLKVIITTAKAAGSFQEIEPFDISSLGEAGDESIKIEVFGCKFKMSKILDIDTSSTDETEFELPFEVTSPDFIRIDGVPYAKDRNNKS